MGTVSRVFGNVHYDFKYETIKPIAKALIGFDDLDDPEVDNPVADNQIISVLHLMVKEKNAEINELKDREERIEAKHDKEIERVQVDAQRKIDSLNRDKRNLWATVAILAVIILAIVVADLIVPSRGWILRNTSAFIGPESSAMIRTVAALIRSLFS